METQNPILYLVGGTVRDKCMNLPATNDIDIAVEAHSFEEMKRYLVGHRAARILVDRPEFGNIKAQVPHINLGKFGGFLPPPKTKDRRELLIVDFTLCREETMYSDMRHPDKVTPTTIQVDLTRRDFTVNAIAVREDGKILDPYNGQDDCKKMILRCVGSAKDRFTEDPLRMVRALRFAVTRNLAMDHLGISNWLNDKDFIEAGMRSLPKERIQQELKKMFDHDTLSSFYILNNHRHMMEHCFRENKLKVVTQ